jgi:uncharacterized membrane protein
MEESLVQRIIRVTSRELSGTMTLVAVVVAAFLVFSLLSYLVASIPQGWLSGAKAASSGISYSIITAIVFYAVPFCLLLFLPVFYLLVKDRKDRNKLLVLYLFMLVMVTVVNGYISRRIFD